MHRIISTVKIISLIIPIWKGNTLMGNVISSMVIIYLYVKRFKQCEGRCQGWDVAIGVMFKVPRLHGLGCVLYYLWWYDINILHVLYIGKNVRSPNLIIKFISRFLFLMASCRRMIWWNISCEQKGLVKETYTWLTSKYSYVQELN